MERKDFDKEEDYLEFRRKANNINRKYYSKPEVKLRKAAYKKKYDQLPSTKDAEKRRRATPGYKARYKKWEQENKVHLKNYISTPEYKARKKISDKKYYNKIRQDPIRVIGMNKKQRELRLKNIERSRAYNKKYLKTKKGNMNYRYHNQRRIALLKNIPSELSSDNMKKIFDRDKCCVYCGSSIRLEIDHIVPLSSGGNSLMNNLVLSCKTCNCSKHAKDVILWCKLMNRPIPSIIREFIILQRIKD